MKAMDTPQLAPIEKFPKHSVPNTVVEGEMGTSGMTYSAEIKGDTQEGLAEVSIFVKVFLSS